MYKINDQINGSSYDILVKFYEQFFKSIYKESLKDKIKGINTSLMQSRNLVHETLSNNEFKLMIIYNDNVPVGVARYRILKEELIIHEVIIDANYRKNGIYYFLLHYFEDLAYISNLKNVVFEVPFNDFVFIHHLINQGYLKNKDTSSIKRVYGKDFSS